MYSDDVVDVEVAGTTAWAVVTRRVCVGTWTETLGWRMEAWGVRRVPAAPARLVAGAQHQRLRPSRLGLVERRIGTFQRNRGYPAVPEWW